MSRSAEQIRNDVATTYGKRVTGAAPGSCCGSGRAQDAGDTRTKDCPLAAGYSKDDLNTLPADAVSHSFGCGNPVALAGLGVGDVVLDLGAGAGIDLILASRKVGTTGRVIGIDMTDEMIAKANENIGAAGILNAEVRKGFIEDLPVEDASVDWVISNCVINLSPEKHRVFREIHRVLKPGGRMLVSDIVAKELPEELRDIPALHSYCIAGAVSEEEYLAGLRHVGMADVEVKDRLVYDAVRIAGFAASTLAQDYECGTQIPLDRILDFARALEGKVWSAKVYGRKPD
ncbi:MAG: arsenite methyltransferase [bacterium]|jgi:SAM-dependent methyltransferase